MVLILLGLLAVVSEPYRLKRVVALINPDLYGSGYVITKVRDLLFHSKLFGNETYGIMLKIPVESDFTLTYIIYNFGIVFGIICIAIIATFIVRIFNIIRKIKDSYGRNLMLSIGSIFLMQIIINMLSNLGIMSLFIALPFICFGSSNSIISISMVKLICSIYKRRGISDKAVINN